PCFYPNLYILIKRVPSLTSTTKSESGVHRLVLTRDEPVIAESSRYDVTQRLPLVWPNIKAKGPESDKVN
ncbi:hypothetical protein Bpfe_017892, partial [Biomphalaria pfeifferi]